MDLRACNGKIWDLPVRTPSFKYDCESTGEDLTTHLLEVSFEEVLECEQLGFIEVGIYKDGFPLGEEFRTSSSRMSSLVMCPICKGTIVVTASSVSCGVCLGCGEVLAPNEEDKWKAINVFHACKNYGMLGGFIMVIEHFDIKSNSYFVV